LVDW
jgi:hypothetical protein